VPLIFFDLEGPLSPQDNAYEVMGLIPDGHRLFEVISRYDDLLTLEGREDYEPGDTLRLIVPWKYGFKGVKSIVRIRFVESQPRNTWQMMAPSEYGFYANVNPEVDHPRWSQARERRLPAFIANRRTEMFNGYTEQVAHMYKGMDLRKNY